MSVTSPSLLPPPSAPRLDSNAERERSRAYARRAPARRAKPGAVAPARAALGRAQRARGNPDAQPQARAARALAAGGGIGIRTLGTVSRTRAFQARPFDHSGIPPCRVLVFQR